MTGADPPKRRLSVCRTLRLLKASYPGCKRLTNRDCGRPGGPIHPEKNQGLTAPHLDFRATKAQWLTDIAPHPDRANDVAEGADEVSELVVLPLALFRQAGMRSQPCAIRIAIIVLYQALPAAGDWAFVSHNDWAAAAGVSTSTIAKASRAVIRLGLVERQSIGRSPWHYRYRLAPAWQVAA